MNILSSLFLALGLSMDNFAVAIASGCTRQRVNFIRYSLTVSLVFVLAHVLMFTAGWFGGKELGKIVSAIDHWAAFLILAVIGGRMIYSAYKGEEKVNLCGARTFKTILWLAAATSLDALMVGMGAAFGGDMPLGQLLLFIALCVFATSLCGFWLGSFLGRKFGRFMEAAGGVVLVGIGSKILLEHLHIL